MTPIILTAYRAGRLVWTGYLDEGPMLIRLHRNGVKAVHEWVEHALDLSGEFCLSDLYIRWRYE